MRTRNSFEWNKNYPFTDISGGKRAEGKGRQREKERDRKEESGAGAGCVAGWLSVLAHTRVEKLCFQHQFTPTFSRRARTRWIKLGILRKETRPHIRRIVIRPLHSLVAVAAFLSLALSASSSLLANLSFSRPPGFLVSSFAKRPLCRSYFALPWGLPGLPGLKKEEGNSEGERERQRKRKRERDGGERDGGRIVRACCRENIFFPETFSDGAIPRNERERRREWDRRVEWRCCVGHNCGREKRSS